MAIAHIIVADRGLAAYLHMRGFAIKSFHNIGGRLEFEFAMGQKKFESMRREYFGSPICKFDQAKMSLIRLTQYAKEGPEAKPKDIAPRAKKARPKTKMDESQVIPGRPKRMINL